MLWALSLEKHPDKMFIGRIERGFDFLGYHFSPAGLAMAKKTIANFIEKASRLYEQKRSAVSAATALEMYVRRWLGWARGGFFSNRRHRAEQDRNDSKFQEFSEQEAETATFDFMPWF